MEFIQLHVTFSSQVEAEGVATGLVESNCVACAQIEGPIMSVYRWQGQTRSEPEWRLVMKTRKDLFEKVSQVVSEMHTYDVPQIVALPLVNLSPAYRGWLSSQLESFHEKESS